MNDARQNVHRATAWLDGKLVPILGPATNGPWEASSTEDQHPGDNDQLCPVCHHAMRHHVEETVPNSHHVFLWCPDADTVIETERMPHTVGPQMGPVLT